MPKYNSREVVSVIKVKDKTFRVSIPETVIKAKVKEVADRMSRDMAGKNPLLLAVLNGSFIFAADLMRMMSIPCEIAFVRLSSYSGTASTGKVREVMGLDEDLTGRTVVIVEDIIESGLTVKRMKEMIMDKAPASVRICTLLLKPARLEVEMNIDYVAMEIPDDFILGYGLDYDQQGRNLRDIYTIVDE